MRVLISAYACERGVGSEPENGYNYVRAAAARHEVTVLTHERFAAHVREQIVDGDLKPVRVVGFPTAAWTQRGIGKPGLGHLDYLFWQRTARTFALQHLAEFDVLHHATFGTDWMPAGVLGIDAVPVVWGSVGGCAPVPWRLVRFLSRRDIAAEIARELLTRPLRMIARRKVLSSRCLVVARNHDTERFYRSAGAEVVLSPQVVALPQPAIRSTATGSTAPPVPGVRRALFVSKLVGWKGPLLAVDTLAHLGPEWRLEFYGQGPLSDEVRRRAARRGLSDRVVLHGRVPKTDVLDALRQADVLLFPSMHDSSPMPVAEAGWAGCPVVCLDVAGPPVLIQGTTGRAVPADRHAARALAAAVTQVRRHPPATWWSAESLEETVDGWYRRAAGSAAHRDASAPR